MKNFTWPWSTSSPILGCWCSLVSGRKFLKTGVGTMVPILLFFLLLGSTVSAQVQIPLTDVNEANFGVEASLYANDNQNTPNIQDPLFIDSDDWFANLDLWPGDGTGVINVNEGDAISKINAWLADVNANISDTLRQSVPIYTEIEGRTWIDALYARDQRTNGKLTDASFYTSGDDKNFHDPETWTIGTGSGGPQKNDIIEFFGHLRRDVSSTPGPTPDLGTEFAFLGATTRSQNGTSHLDFELFRNELVRNGAKLISEGPDCNRTAYRFDLAGTDEFDDSNSDDGSVLTHGDIIFSINYENGGDNVLVELYIWISREDFPDEASFMEFNNLGNNPFNFGSASGAFRFFECNEDPNFGYAQVSLVEARSEGWVTAQINQEEVLGPPWKTYDSGGNQQEELPVLSFIELSINATELGLDTGSTGGECEKPLGTIVVKTRSSASFTAELKDLLGPFPFGAIPPVDVTVDDEELNCTLDFVTLEAKLGTAGNFKFQWYKKNESGTYEEIPGATGPTYNATEAGEYKVMVTQILSNGTEGCTDEDEAEVTGTNVAPELVTTCPDPDTVTCNDDISTAFSNWLGGFDISGGGGEVTATYSVSIDGGEATEYDFDSWPQGITEPEDACGAYIEVTLDASDECEQIASCSSTFTVSESTPVDVDGPEDVDTEACAYVDDAALQAAYTAWLAEFETLEAGCGDGGSFTTTPP
ncbi:hypothetical protein FLP08_15255, partial [Gramella aestuarii]